MEEKKKFDWKIVAILVMAVLLVVCFVQISGIKDQNQRLSNDIAMYRNEVSNLRADIAAIYSNVDEQLKKEASLFSGVDFAFGEMNAENKTVKMSLSVVPKLISDDMNVSATVDGKTVELQKNNNAFVGGLDIGLFLENAASPLITIKTEAGTQTEFLEDIKVNSLFNRFLPVLHSNMEGRATYSGGKLKTDLTMILDCKAMNSGVSFTSYTIVESIDGVEVNRTDISAAVSNSLGHYTQAYKKEIALNEGQRFEVFVVAEDTCGYIHKIRAYEWANDSIGADIQTWISGESIYDKDGNMLYGVKYIEVH